MKSILLWGSDDGYSECRKISMCAMKIVLLLAFIAVCLEAQGVENIIDGCPPGYFSCQDEGRTCIYATQWCNRVVECRNRYDESFCNQRRNRTHPVVCPPAMIPCKTEGCYPRKGKCDGYNSCQDGSDEEDCQRQTTADQRQQPPPSQDLSNVEDYDDDFREDREDYSDEDKRAVGWVLKQRRDYAWGDDTERAIAALSLSEDGFKTDSETEDMLTVKSLHLRISLALRNLHEYPLSHRALFINALNASCGDPRNFYGYDLVSDLRSSVNKMHRNHDKNFVPPIVYLALCLSNMAISEDIDKIRYEVTRLTDSPKNDLKALFLLTTVCMEKHQTDEDNKKKLENIRKYLVKNLFESNTEDAENIYELALVTQALNAAQLNPELWNRDEKMKSIRTHQDVKGSFGDMLATYYVMPLLSGKTFLDIGDQCSPSTNNDSPFFETRRNSKGVMSVNYTLNFGPEKISQTMFLSVLNGSSIYDVMNLAVKKNNNFRFSLDDKKSAPLVYSVGGTPNDAESGLFWNVEVIRTHQHYRSQSTYQVPNIKLFKLEHEDAIIFSIRAYN